MTTDYLTQCAEAEGGRARLCIDGYANAHTAAYFAREAAHYAGQVPERLEAPPTPEPLTAARAGQLGAAAHAAGLPCSPALDAEMFAAIQADECPVLMLWSFITAWTNADRARPDTPALAR